MTEILPVYFSLIICQFFHQNITFLNITFLQVHSILNLVVSKYMCYNHLKDCTMLITMFW